MVIGLLNSNHVSIFFRLLNFFKSDVTILIGQFVFLFTFKSC